MYKEKPNAICLVANTFGLLYTRFVAEHREVAL